ncbi:MAG: excinuclease ABC subunit UvrA [bacterium]
MTQQYIKIKGARQHNLKNIDLDIPKNQFVVMTGVSGSGKSSLAFDTIYAEGQRRYVESLSSYARQFLGLMDKPDVDQIDGLSPSISIDQKTTSHNPRSTVGTITEIYDYLRLLYARLGHPHCPNDGTEITKLALDEIVAKVMEQISEHTAANKPVPVIFKLLSPVVRAQKGEYRDLFKNLISKGYPQAIIDGQEYSLTQDISLIKTNKHTISAIIDTFSVSYKDQKNDEFNISLRSRLTTAISQATGLSLGLVILMSNDIEQLYSEHFSCPVCGHSLPELEPRMFSFNSPLGACETCKGLGVIEKIDIGRILNPKLTIKEGGILPMNRMFFHETWFTRLYETVAKEEQVALNTTIGDMSKRDLDILLYGTDKEYRVEGKNRFGTPTSIVETWKGIIPTLEEKYYSSESEWARGEIHQYMVEVLCSSCLGKKLKKEILGVTLDNFNIIDITDLSVKELLHYYQNDLTTRLNSYDTTVGHSIFREIISRLSFLENVGLGYLNLGRKAKTLSGGEQQRIRLASQIGTGLTGVLYVLDEPSIGLHARDVAALIGSLRHLVELGNTLLVVEHDEETIRAADYIVEIGPKAGAAGGHVMAQGTIDELIKDDKSLTGAYLSGSKSIITNCPELKQSLGTIKLSGAKENNLKNVTLSLPLGNLIGITGVSGGGKSTLITDTLYPALRYYVDGYFSEHMGKYDRLDGYQYVKEVYLVDQSPIGRTPRSNPATYVGFFDDIRELFSNTEDARLRGFEKGRFSFNTKGGRCEKCQGGGVIKIEMQFLPDVYVTCDVCEGKRYNRETLEVTYKNKTIYDILDMTIQEGVEFFKSYPKIGRKLKVLVDVGLGYLKIGQGSPTLSGGEAQRIKLASELSRREGGNTVYILDEPTTGLHFEDINKLLDTLRELVKKGNTVIVIEHNLDVIKNCQYLVDMGPEGGAEGGDILFQGPTEDILKVSKSYTAKYLKKYL